MFTAIVTTFTLDVLSDLTEDTSTQLLRILVEQATEGLAVNIPQPGPPSYTVAVSSLWLLSIISSLAATTWAMLSLEWCAILTEDTKAEDYEEMAEKRQRKFEAIRRWKMHIVVASIPFFLHLSLFLFLAGLWLRLRDVNRQLGFVVGIPSLIIASSYVIVTLLPMFTEAPFFTSVSEMVNPLVNELRYLLRLRHFVHAPPIFTWISRSLASGFHKSLSYLVLPYNRLLLLPLRAVITHLISSLKYIHRFTGPVAYAMWRIVKRILREIFPTFQPGGDPFKELNKLRIGSSDRNEGVHQRALFWLMNTPLNQSEVKEVLKEFSNHHNLENDEEPLDRSILKLLILSLSSVLENGRITEDERPIFDHCTKLLTEEMSRTFRAAEYNPRILVRNTVISNGLKKYVDLKPSDPPPPTPGDYDYWNKVVRLLWLSPSKEQIQNVIEKLKSSIQSMGPSLLPHVVHGLHAATLTSLEASKQQTLLDFPLLDFNKWPLWDDGSTSDGERAINDRLADDDRPKKKRLDLNKELLAFLQNLFTKFHEAAQPPGQKRQSPTTLPSLIVACIKLLDEHPQGNVPLRFHNALCFFVTMMWRNDPSVFDPDPSVAQALIASVKDFVARPTPDTSDHSKKIAIRLHTIANGPKHITSWPYTPSETVASLYDDHVKNDPECLSGFIHATAAVLETVLAWETRPGVLDWRYHTSRKVVQSIVAPSYFTDQQAFDLSNDSLPYLYSLAIALSRGIERNGRDPLEVLYFLRAPGKPQTNTNIERTLDTGILVVNVLRRTLSRQLEPAELQTHLDTITQALQLLQRIIENRVVYSWRTRWKAIYLLADLRNVLPRALSDFPGLETLIKDTSNVVEAYISKQLPDEPAPCDWKTKKDGLSLCGLEEAVKEFARRSEVSKEVYSWCEPGNIPYLSLYPHRTQYDPTSLTPYRLLEKLQQ